MKKTGKIGLVAVIAFFGFLLFLTFPIALAPSKTKIAETVSRILQVEIPEEFRVIESDAWEAPAFQIQGIIYTEEVTIEFSDIDFRALERELTDRYQWKTWEGENRTYEESDEKGRYYFLLPADTTQLSYKYAER